MLFLRVVDDPDDYIVYVKEGGTGQGTSWADAVGTIQSGIDLRGAAPGDEVWVAAGTYYEPFSMVSGVSVLGGFEVGDVSRKDRDGHAGRDNHRRYGRPGASRDGGDGADRGRPTQRSGWLHDPAGPARRSLRSQVHRRSLPTT